MSATILILGGYGVFGGSLARQLLRQTSHRVLVAGRSLAKAQAFCASHGGEPCQIDRDDTEELHCVFGEANPDIVVDCSGPFDFDGTDESYRVALAALEAGAHYMDLADNADFVANISLIDDAAQRAGKTALSGVSSVPCLSSAAVAELAKDLQSIESIEASIIPGNRAPRGRAVVESILSQAGQPFAQLEDGQWMQVRCWGSVRRCSLEINGTAPIRNRLVSPIEVPDQRLFPAAFGAGSVRFSAGLELRILHLGLWAMTALVRLRLVRNLRPLTGVMHRIASWFEPLGSDRGGMTVALTGLDSRGQSQQRRWTLIAEAGDGPNIPAIPARALTDSLLAGLQRPGARPAVDNIPLADIERHFAPFRIVSEITSDQCLRTITEPAEYPAPKLQMTPRSPG